MEISIRNAHSRMLEKLNMEDGEGSFETFYVMKLYPHFFLCFSRVLTNQQ